MACWDLILFNVPAARWARVPSRVVQLPDSRPCFLPAVRIHVLVRLLRGRDAELREE